MSQFDLIGEYFTNMDSFVEKYKTHRAYMLDTGSSNPSERYFFFKSKEDALANKEEFNKHEYLAKVYYLIPDTHLAF